MRRPLATMTILLLAVTVSEGQLWKAQRLEIIGGLGTTQFFGDIGGFSETENILGFKDFTFRQTRFNLSIGGNYRITQEINARVNLAYGMLRADDKRGSNVARGFASTTNFFETTILGEFYFVKNQAENSFLFSRKRAIAYRPRAFDLRGFGTEFFSKIDMYVFTGAGVLAYSVKGNDALVARGMTDGGMTMVIPVGLGVKYIYSNDLNYGVEFGGRYSFSDYLEGYTSPFSKHNDLYYFLNATVTYKLPTVPKFIKKR